MKKIKDKFAELVSQNANPEKVSVSSIQVNLESLISIIPTAKKQVKAILNAGVDDFDSLYIEFKDVKRREIEQNYKVQDIVAEIDYLYHGFLAPQIDPNVEFNSENIMSFSEIVAFGITEEGIKEGIILNKGIITVEYLENNDRILSTECINHYMSKLLGKRQSVNIFLNTFYSELIGLINRKYTKKSNEVQPHDSLLSTLESAYIELISFDYEHFLFANQDEYEEVIEDVYNLSKYLGVKLNSSTIQEKDGELSSNIIH